MKVYLLEAVDPEDRKVRVHHLYKKAGLLKTASGMAHKAGNPKESKRLWLKSQRFKFAGMRDTQSYRQVTKLYKQAGGDKKPVPPAKGPGVERVGRLARLYKIRKFAKDTMSSPSEKGTRRVGIFQARRASGIAKAYSGDKAAKNVYKNVHRDQDRKDVKHARTAAAWVTPGIADKIKPGLRAKSKINKTDRAQRILNLINTGSKSREAAQSAIRGDHEMAARLGTPGKSKRQARDGGEKTAYDHNLDAQRAHTLAAKFLKTPGKREKYNQALKHLRKGHTITGRVKDWGKLQNPLSHLGVRTVE